jgi:hypothetical protein
MFSNYECSLFTVLCNTGSLQLYDLLFVPLIPWILYLMPVAHCRFWKFKLSNRTQVVPGPLVSINLYRGRQGPASSICQPILSTNHGGLARRSAGASVARRAALRRARLPVSAHVPRWRRWWPVRLLRRRVLLLRIVRPAKNILRGVSGVCALVGSAVDLYRLPETSTWNW